MDELCKNCKTFPQCEGSNIEDCERREQERSNKPTEAQTKEDKRTPMVFGIMTRLNDTKRQGTDGYYDCGELGIFHLWWGRHGWEWQWIEIGKEFITSKEATNE